MKSSLVSALAVAVMGLAACDRPLATSPTAPDTQSTQTAPTVTEVAVSGRTELSVVGETTQLTAMAAFSDGSNRGITGEALWTSSDASVLTVSATGMVTVVRFGSAYISATYDTKSDGQTIEAVASRQ
jgi:hypothetical protein